MVEDLIKWLRDTVKEEAGHGVRNEAADLIKRQAEDIAENDAIIDELRDHLTALESKRDALLAAAGKEAVAIAISTEKICEIAGKYDLGNPRLDALRGFVNEIIIVNGAEYAKSE